MILATVSDPSAAADNHSERDADAIQQDVTPLSNFEMQQSAKSNPHKSDVFCFEKEEEEDEDVGGDNEHIPPQAKRLKPERECATSLGNDLLFDFWDYY